MYDTLTPRWAIFLMGMVAGILGVVPFIAYWKGPEIRARSPFSRILMAEEKARVAAAEQEQKESDMSRSVDMSASVAAERDIEAQAGTTGTGRPGQGNVVAGATADSEKAMEIGDMGRVGRMARQLTGASTTDERAPPPIDRLNTGLRGRGEWDDEVRDNGQAQMGFQKGANQ